MLAIRLPETIEKRLDRLFKRTGRTKTYYAREAILRHLDDLEDIYPRREGIERNTLGTQPDYSARRSNAAPWLEGISQVYP